MRGLKRGMRWEGMANKERKSEQRGRGKKYQVVSQGKISPGTKWEESKASYARFVYWSSFKFPMAICFPSFSAFPILPLHSPAFLCIPTHYSAFSPHVNCCSFKTAKKLDGIFQHDFLFLLYALDSLSNDMSIESSSEESIGKCVS